jgi:large subunit ribosomal protein LP1
LSIKLQEKTHVNISKALEGKDVKDMLLNVGSGGGAAAAPVAGGAAAAGGAAGGAAAAPAEEEKKEEGTFSLCWNAERQHFSNKFTEKEESDEDMGFGLFD